MGSRIKMTDHPALGGGGGGGGGIAHAGMSSMFGQQGDQQKMSVFLVNVIK